MVEKIYKILCKIYAITMMIAFFAGFIPVIPFIIAIIIGGPAGEAISLFMYNKVYPVAFAIASVSVLIGLQAMYITGQESLSVTSYVNEEE